MVKEVSLVKDSEGRSAWQVGEFEPIPKPTVNTRKPKAPAVKKLWGYTNYPRQDIPNTTETHTKSEARADFKSWLGVSKLPDGAIIEELIRPMEEVVGG